MIIYNWRLLMWKLSFLSFPEMVKTVITENTEFFSQNLWRQMKTKNLFYRWTILVILNTSIFKFTFLIIWQFSKTAYFLDQKISNTWLKKAWWKRTLIMLIILVNIFKTDYISSTFIVKQKLNPMWPKNKFLNNDTLQTSLCECFVPRKQFLFSG